MKKYTRKTPQFSLCGLNCCLCPRYRTTGSSRCPGCGGEDFHEKHPACGIISCSMRHDGVEYCFQCKEYPCARYTRPNDKDSFITYSHVPMDMDAAKESGIESYVDQLSAKCQILDQLLDHWDNGRLKSYFCLTVNLFPLEELELVMITLENIKRQEDNATQQQGADAASGAAINGKLAKEYFDKVAANKGISLQLRR